MKKIMAIVLAAVILLSLAACGTQPATSTANAPATSAKPVLTLNIAHKGDPTGLNHLATGSSSTNGPISPFLYDNLLQYNSDTNQVEPMLATAWEYTDNTHIKFTLRKDVVAHDGSKFTAKDVIYTLKNGQELMKNARNFQNFDIPNCKVVDDNTVIVALKQVDPFALYNLAFSGALGMVVQAAVEKNGGTLNQQLQKPTAGTGPYKFVEWVPGSYVKLARNENYWGPKAYYDFVVFKIITDTSARVMNLESGGVDVALEPAINDLARLGKDNKYTLINKPTAINFIMTFNTQNAPFNDVKARQAVALALDYKSNLAVAAGGYGTISDSLLPTSNINYIKPDGSYQNYFHLDIDAAKKKLAESSYPNGFSFELIYNEGATYQAFAELIQNQLAKIGIKVTLKPTSSTAFFDLENFGKFQANLSQNSNPDPNLQFNRFDPRTLFTKGGGGAGWTSAPSELVPLLDQAMVTVDMAKSKQIFAKLQAIINENCPAIPIYSPNKTCLTKAGITNVKFTLFSDIDLSQAKSK